MNEGGLKIRDLRVKHGAQTVLHGLDLALDAGEMLILVGPSGCGKSTLLNAVAGLQAIAGGSIELDGRRIEGLSPRERDIAMVFQSYALYPHMTVAENLGFALEMRGWSRTQRDARIREVAQMLQLQELLERKPAQLSGGQRQRVAMGRALARQPRLFLFDEPLSNLDAQLRAEMRGEIKLLQQRLGRGALYVTHDQVEAMTLGHRVAVLRDGHLQQLGTPQQVYQQPANLFVAQFLSSPALNLLPARLDTEGGLRLPLRGTESASWAIERAALPPLERLLGRKLLLGWRADALRLEDGASDAHCLRLAAPLRLVEPLGEHSLLQFQLGEHRLQLRMPGWPHLQAGQCLGLALPAEGLMVFDAETGESLGAAQGQASLVRAA